MDSLIPTEFVILQKRIVTHSGPTNATPGPKTLDGEWITL
jgi:hypothetical protein